MNLSPYQPTIMITPFTWQSIEGWFTFADVYCEQLSRLEGKSSIMVEVGSWFGQSTAYAATFIKQHEMDCKFYAVDTWLGSPNEALHQHLVRECGGDVYRIWQENMAKCEVQDYIIPLRLPSIEAAKDFEDGSIDFVYIDAAHDFDSVVADIRAWYPKVAKGGCLAGHDINLDGVKRAVEQELSGRWRQQDLSWIVDRI